MGLFVDLVPLVQLTKNTSLQWTQVYRTHYGSGFSVEINLSGELGGKLCPYSTSAKRNESERTEKLKSFQRIFQVSLSLQMK